MCSKIWAEGTVNTILKEGSLTAIITDARFPDEIQAVQDAGGKVIRFTRSPYKDEHQSEMALNPDVFNWKKFDAVIDNAKMTIDEQNTAVCNTFVEWGWMADAGTNIGTTDANSTL